MIPSKGRSNGFLTSRNITRSYTILLNGPGARAFIRAGSRLKPFTMLSNSLTCSTDILQSSYGDEGDWISEVEESRAMHIWRVWSIGHFLLSILLVLEPGSVQMVSGDV